MRISVMILMAFGLSACGGGGSSAGSSAPSVVPSTPVAPTVPTAPINPIKGSLELDVELSDYHTTPDQSAFAITDELRQVVELTNRLRAEKGIAPLVIDESLSRYANIRAVEAHTLFKHTRPDGSNAVAQGNITGYGYVGENMAAGRATAAKAVEQWRNSTGHYQNLMNPNFTKIGVGYNHQANSQYRHTWIQIFGSGSIDAFEAKSALRVSSDAVERQIKNSINVGANGITINANKQTVREANSHRGGIHAQPYVLDLGNQQRIVLRPHQSAGWSFQTIGELQHFNHPVAYVNVGQEFTPASDAVIQGRYVGKSIGDVGKHSRVIADVVADVDFSGSRKTMTLNLNNSEIAYQDLGNNPAALQRQSTLDFTETLVWDGDEFKNGHGSAKFYGANAQELGGQFERDYDYNTIIESYKGAYGAVRQ